MLSRAKTGILWIVYHLQFTIYRLLWPDDILPICTLAKGLSSWQFQSKHMFSALKVFLQTPFKRLQSSEEVND